MRAAGRSHHPLNARAQRSDKSSTGAGGGLNRRRHDRERQHDPLSCSATNSSGDRRRSARDGNGHAGLWSGSLPDKRVQRIPGLSGLDPDDDLRDAVDQAEQAIDQGQADRPDVGTGAQDDAQRN